MKYLLEGSHDGYLISFICIVYLYDAVQHANFYTKEDADITFVRILGISIELNVYIRPANDDIMSMVNKSHDLNSIFRIYLQKAVF